MISANPSSSQQLPQKEIQPQKPLEAPAGASSLLLLLKMSLSASSQLWALMLAASAVLKWSG